VRECPICREKIWPRVDLKNPGWTWRALHEHVRNDHQGYWSWNRRTSYYYLIPLILFVGGSLQAILLLLDHNPSAVLIPLLVILFSWLGALLVGASILSVKEKGKQQFRVIWLAEHRYPVS
jgi:hypothetical protein